MPSQSSNDQRSILLKNEVNSRRSQRVIARIRVSVRQPEKGAQSPETGYTLVVNAHGALISVDMKVSPNEFLAIKNVHTGEEKRSRVIRVSDEQQNANQIAIEFIDPSPRFWRIDFPPTDWKMVRDDESDT
jgi:hypothetical protein